jgi:His/Glu/Gln/Arg/opine family amino acid ABC transporter permease subunit
MLCVSLLAGCSKQETTKMATIEDMANKRIGVCSGFIYDKFATERFPAATIHRYNSQTDLLLAVKSEKVDVAITNYAAAKIMLKDNSEVGILTDEILTFPIGVGFNKNNPELRARFNAFLQARKADGSLAAMYKKWFENDLETIQMPKFQANPNGHKVVLGVAIGDLPSSGYANGEYVGFDIELIQTFAAQENINLEILSMDFAALIASLASGKVDMIADCIAINAERQKQVDFSAPYMEDKTAVMGLKKNIAHLAGSAPQAMRSGGFIQSVTDGFYSNIIHENRYLLILDGLKTTVVISFFAVVFGTLLGAFICFLRMSRRRLFQALARVYISLMRGVPVLVLLMIMYYVVFGKANVSPVLVAVLAFGINFAAYVSEMFRSAIESIDRGQTEAGIAGGFSKIQTFIYIIMPQAIRRVLSVYKGEVISLVKMTSIVGYIAVQDLTKASDIIRSRTFDAFFPLLMTAVLYFAISALLLQLLDGVEHLTDPRRKQSDAKRTGPFSTSKLLLVAALVLGLGGGIYFYGSPAALQNKPAALVGQIKNLTDLGGKRVAVITGTTGDFVIREKYKTSQVVDMVYPADAALALRTNKVDAFVFDRNTLQYILAKNQPDFEILPERLSTVEIAIPMRRDATDLHRQVNESIAHFKQDGTIEKLKQKWILSHSTPTVAKINLDGRNGVLRMGTCLLSEPYAFMSSGAMAGLDIELAYLLAERLGMKLEITDMSYDAMIAALQVGKIDLAIANFYKLNERQAACEFSIPYLQNDIAAMVRRQQP